MPVKYQKLAILWKEHLHGGAAENSINTAICILLLRSPRSIQLRLLRHLTGESMGNVFNNLDNISNVSTQRWMHQDNKTKRPDLWLWNAADLNKWNLIEGARNYNDARRILEVQNLLPLPKSILIEVKWLLQDTRRDRALLARFRGDHVYHVSLAVRSEHFYRLVEIARSSEQQSRDPILEFALAFLEIHVDHTTKLKVAEWTTFSLLEAALNLIELIHAAGWEQDKDSPMKSWDKLSLPSRLRKVGGASGHRKADLPNWREFILSGESPNPGSTWKRTATDCLQYFTNNFDQIGGLTITSRDNAISFRFLEL